MRTGRMVWRVSSAAYGVHANDTIFSVNNSLLSKVTPTNFEIRESYAAGVIKALGSRLRSSAGGEKKPASDKQSPAHLPQTRAQRCVRAVTAAGPRAAPSQPTVCHAQRPAELIESCDPYGLPLITLHGPAARSSHNSALICAAYYQCTRDWSLCAIFIKHISKYIFILCYYYY
ncbi:hypothetical protein SKAU_G00338160 [Synaphobranchus kaupii]|uniref:Uncharacterized protein n=1 Tax=Synaphobranchus kaupii TaxID=118154 RepID=A0A9Q1EME4_SYNKA|nr:hypothetical protein SKAU_G00338160 [Synaphobranchus kaupii]